MNAAEREKEIFSAPLSIIVLRSDTIMICSLSLSLSRTETFKIMIMWVVNERAFRAYGIRRNIPARNTDISSQ